MKTVGVFGLVGIGLLACGGAETAPATPPAAPVASAAPVVARTPPRVDPSLIPRDVLFGNPDHRNVQLSVDGKWLGYLGPVDGVMNVLVAPATVPFDATKARPLTHEKARPISRWAWTKQPGKLVYFQDVGGDENFHAQLVDVASGKVQDLAPFKDARADLAGLSSRHPNEILLSINDRDPKFPDLYRVDLGTAKRTLVQKNEGFEGFDFDADFKPRVAWKQLPDGSRAAFTAKGDKFDQQLLAIPFDDALTTTSSGLDETGKTLYLVDSRARDTAALFAIDLATKKPTELVADAKSDAFIALKHPRTWRPLLGGTDYERRADVVLDKAFQADIDYLKTVVPGADVSWEDCNDDLSRCVIAFGVSDGPVRYHLYDRAKKKAEYLFPQTSSLDKVKLARMHARVLKARDGLDLVSYLTLPPGSDADGDGTPDRALPLVLNVHGGPWGRDEWGYDPIVQWLASRGYAVLNVNFRGSVGFGRKFVNAGNLEWTGKMHDDLLDAVKWAVDGKIADPQKVAVVGISYGGYSALVSATFTPDQFACAVDEVGPVNLVTLQETMPPYWESFREQIYRRVGDPRTEAGRKLLLERSPLTRVSVIKRPLLIGQGANDPRVNRNESEQIVNAMKAKNIPVTYALFPDEGHGFHRPENRKAFTAVSEIFLAQCLGGAYEPIGKSFEGASMEIPVGAEQIHGLAAAMKK